MLAGEVTALMAGEVMAGGVSALEVTTEERMARISPSNTSTSLPPRGGDAGELMAGELMAGQLTAGELTAEELMSGEVQAQAGR